MRTLLKLVLMALPLVQPAFAADVAHTSAREQPAVRVEAVQADRASYAALTEKMRPAEVPAAVRERASLGSEAIIRRPPNQLGLIRL